MCSCQSGFQGPRCQYGRSLVFVHTILLLLSNWNVQLLKTVKIKNYLHVLFLFDLGYNDIINLWVGLYMY